MIVSMIWINSIENLIQMIYQQKKTYMLKVLTTMFLKFQTIAMCCHELSSSEQEEGKFTETLWIAFENNDILHVLACRMITVILIILGEL